MGLTPEQIIAKELRRDGLSYDLAESSAEQIIAALGAGDYQIVPFYFTEVGNKLSDTARGVAISLERLEVGLFKLDEAIDLWESR